MIETIKKLFKDENGKLIGIRTEYDGIEAVPDDYEVRMKLDNLEKKLDKIIAKEDERCRQEEMKKEYWRWMHSLANVLNPMIENLSLVLDEDKMFWQYEKKFVHDEREVNDLCYLHDVFRNTSEGSFIIHCLENRLKENKALKYFTSMTMLYFKKKD